MRWSFLLNRYIITFGAIGILSGALNLYVALNNDGIIMGYVLGPDNRPVEGASVILSEKSLLVATPRGETRSDSEGKFTFTGHDCYRIYLEAKKEGVGRSKMVEYRLYFRGQNKKISEPLRLKPD